ncbi:TadE/TadG family type IV pilus assembly protein [Microbacterium aurum]
MRRLRDDDDGSSAVEFVLVGTLLTLLTLAVLQLALAVYIRNVVHDAAVEGAYHGALADTDAAAGAARTAALISTAVGGALDAEVSVPTPTATAAQRWRSPSSRPCRSSGCSACPAEWR